MVWEFHVNSHRPAVLNGSSRTLHLQETLERSSIPSTAASSKMLDCSAAVACHILHTVAFKSYWLSVFMPYENHANHPRSSPPYLRSSGGGVLLPHGPSSWGSPTLGAWVPFSDWSWNDPAAASLFLSGKRLLNTVCKWSNVVQKLNLWTLNFVALLAEKRPSDLFSVATFDKVSKVGPTRHHNITDCSYQLIHLQILQKQNCVQKHNCVSYIRIICCRLFSFFFT